MGWPAGQDELEVPEMGWPAGQEELKVSLSFSDFPSRSDTIVLTSLHCVPPLSQGHLIAHLQQGPLSAPPLARASCEETLRKLLVTAQSSSCPAEGTDELNVS